MFPILLGLLQNKIAPQSLTKILDVVFSSSSMKTAAEKELNKRLQVQTARTAAEQLGRALVKLLDAAIEVKPEGATVDEREKVGTILAQNAAVQLAQVAELLLAYPEVEAEVIRKQEANDKPGTDAAKDARGKAVDKIKGAFVDVARVVIGDDPQDA
jgi:hypothetical protein